MSRQELPAFIGGRPRALPVHGTRGDRPPRTARRGRERPGLAASAPRLLEVRHERLSSLVNKTRGPCSFEEADKRSETLTRGNLNRALLEKQSGRSDGGCSSELRSGRSPGGYEQSPSGVSLPPSSGCVRPPATDQARENSGHDIDSRLESEAAGARDDERRSPWLARLP
jgi:hypothetical protein